MAATIAYFKSAIFPLRNIEFSQLIVSIYSTIQFRNLHNSLYFSIPIHTQIRLNDYYFFWITKTKTNLTYPLRNIGLSQLIFSIYSAIKFRNLRIYFTQKYFSIPIHTQTCLKDYYFFTKTKTNLTYPLRNIETTHNLFSQFILLYDSAI
jgi:hypothetical protein